MHFYTINELKQSDKKKAHIPASILPGSRVGVGADVGEEEESSAFCYKIKRSPCFLGVPNKAVCQRKNWAAFKLKGLALNLDTLMAFRILENILSHNVILRHNNGIKPRYDLLFLQRSR